VADVRLDDSIEDTGAAIRVRSQTVLVGWNRVAFALLTAFLFVSIAIFASYWLRLAGIGAHPVLYAFASLGVAYLIGVWVAPWLSLARMCRPVPMPPPPGLRVAVATTFVPAEESLDLLEHSIAVPHGALALLMGLALATRVTLHGVPRPALLWSALAFIAFSLALVCTEAVRFPPQYEPGLHARRRALLADRLGPP